MQLLRARQGEEGGFHHRYDFCSPIIVVSVPQGGSPRGDFADFLVIVAREQQAGPMIEPSTGLYLIVRELF